MKYKVWLEVEAVPDPDEETGPDAEGYMPYQKAGEPLEVGVFATREEAEARAFFIHSETWDKP